MGTSSLGLNRFVDALESRRLLSSATLKGDVLVVEDDALTDAILIRQQPGMNDAPVYAVEIDPADGSERPSRYWEFPLEKVHFIIVRGFGGNDVIDLAIATYPAPALAGIGPVSVPTWIDAGLGDDQVYGGTARDFISGSFGKDQIQGGDGNDWIDGGWGDDVLHGGRGNDFVYGNAGNDVVGGDEGNDRLYGGAGNDFLGSLGFGPRPTEPGDDLLVGGPGEDRLVGGEGKDRLYGGPGRDHFSRADDASEMLDRTPDEPIDIPLPL